MIELAQILEAWGEAGSLPAMAPSWEQSCQTFGARNASWLADETISAAAQYVGFYADRVRRVVEAAGRLRAIAGMDRVLWHCVQRAFFGERMADFNSWPAWRQVFGDEGGGAFYLLGALVGASLIRDVHFRRGIEDSVTQDTCRQVSNFSQAHERGNAGRIGVYPGQLSWMRNYVYEPYYRLGRFEYWLRPVGFGESAGFVAYRHRTRGNVLALAADGARFDAQGHRTDEARERPAWVASLSEDDREASGCPISPQGFALNRTVRLRLDEWRKVLGPGHWVLDMHIPDGGRMTPDACRASHQAAVGFFDRHEPDRPWSALFGGSWIFSNVLEQILPPEANLVRYTRDLYLVPPRTTGTDGLWFVFLQNQFDVKTAPRDTSIRRAIAEYIEKGGAWRGGAMFMLRDDVLRIGEQHYRSQWAATQAMLA